MLPVCVCCLELELWVHTISCLIFPPESHHLFWRGIYPLPPHIWSPGLSSDGNSLNWTVHHWDTHVWPPIEWQSGYFHWTHCAYQWVETPSPPPANSNVIEAALYVFLPQYLVLYLCIVVMSHRPSWLLFLPPPRHTSQNNANRSPQSQLVGFLAICPALSIFPPSACNTPPMVGSRLKSTWWVMQISDGVHHWPIQIVEASSVDLLWPSPLVRSLYKYDVPPPS